MNYSTMSDDQIDKAVAERLGWHGFRVDSFGSLRGTSKEGVSVRSVPRFSTDIAAAWWLVEKMKEQGFFRMTICSESGMDDSEPAHSRPWFAMFHPWQDDDETYVEYEAFATTASRAICEAWLAATEKTT